MYAASSPDAPYPYQDRPHQETIVEASAYIICLSQGLDTGGRSFPYIAIWARPKRVLQESMGKIQDVAKCVVLGIDCQVAELEGQPEIAGGAPVQVFCGYCEDDGSGMGPESMFVQDEDGASWKLKNGQRHRSSFLEATAGAALRSWLVRS